MRERKGLTAVLVRSDLCDNLGRDIAGREEAVRLLDHGLADHGAVLQHVLQVDEVAVVLALRVIIGVVEVNQALLMRLHNLLGEQNAARQVLRNFSRHVVALGRVDDRVLVRVLLLHFLVRLVNQGEYALVRRIRMTRKASLIAVTNVLLRNLKAAHLHDAGFDHLLDVLDVDGALNVRNLCGNLIRNRLNLVGVHLVNSVHLAVCRLNRIHDFFDVKLHFLAVALNDIGSDLGFHPVPLFHGSSPLDVEYQ